MQELVKQPIHTNVTATVKKSVHYTLQEKIQMWDIYNKDYNARVKTYCNLKESQCSLLVPSMAVTLDVTEIKYV